MKLKEGQRWIPADSIHFELSLFFRRTMGRLLKKKEPGLKKKSKSDENASTETESETASQSLTTQTTAGTVKDNQLKIAPVKKATPGSAMFKINNKYIDQALQFLREVKVELKKVAWPSRKQAMGSTIVV
ncbi:MAG: preprotein translocase subunit SecE, partial [Desulfatirhabdiaceae bacterium]|nr:preprotein translocase subunit SecE [Desulfatirhabdiaceae bacterium]